MDTAKFDRIVQSTLSIVDDLTIRGKDLEANAPLVKALKEHISALYHTAHEPALDNKADGKKPNRKRGA